MSSVFTNAISCNLQGGLWSCEVVKMETHFEVCESGKFSRLWSQLISGVAGIPKQS